MPRYVLVTNLFPFLQSVLTLLSQAAFSSSSSSLCLDSLLPSYEQSSFQVLRTRRNHRYLHHLRTSQARRKATNLKTWKFRTPPKFKLDITFFRAVLSIFDYFVLAVLLTTSLRSCRLQQNQARFVVLTENPFVLFFKMAKACPKHVLTVYYHL